MRCLWVILDELNQDAHHLPLCHFIWRAVSLFERLHPLSMKGSTLDVIFDGYTILDANNVAKTFTLYGIRFFRRLISAQRQKRIPAIPGELSFLLLRLSRRNHAHAQK